MAGRKAGNKTRLTTAAVGMLLVGAVSLIYSITRIFPLFTGTLKALQIPLPFYLVNLILGVLTAVGFIIFGIETLRQPDRPMKRILGLSSGICLLGLTLLSQVVNLLFERYIGETIWIAAIPAAIRVIFVGLWLDEKRLRSSRRPA